MDRSRVNAGFAKTTSRADLARDPQSHFPVAIVGMHRSGTSMVAKLLQQAGLHLGNEEDLMPPADENPEGFYEHLDFVRLNDEVLNAAGAGWDCPPRAGFNWESRALDPFRERARSLAATLVTGAPWGWKDPRTSLTVPFWRSALGPFQAVAVVRNPLEVVTSLHRRNGFSTALGLTLWQLYAERILEDTSPDQRLVVHYDAFFMDSEREIARILEFLGFDHDQDLQSLRATAIPALRHHRRSVRDLEEHGFPETVIDLYLQLCREARWLEGLPEPADGSPEAVPATDNRRSSIAAGIGRVDLIRVENEILKRNIADFSDALADREARVLELELALNNHEALRAELDGKIAERDSRLLERNALIARRDHTIGVQQQQLAQHAEELSRLREQVAALTDCLAESDRNREIAEIHQRELRSMLTDLQAVQLQRDAEIMGTLGAVLSRHAPNAPASIYHRKLVDQVRRFVENHLPAGARTLVATYGDDAMLLLGDRPTQPFPRSAPDVVADYTDVRGPEAVAQLAELRDRGAEFLLVPSPALPWLATHPELERHLEERHTVIARERGIGTIYALSREQGQIPA
ncbi:MAG: sulfotransferase [Chloroflexi bacterium]|nr:sulfotransferase [Chloroflexota bacterium]